MIKLYLPLSFALSLIGLFLELLHKGEYARFIFPIIGGFILIYLVSDMNNSKGRQSR